MRALILALALSAAPLAAHGAAPHNSASVARAKACNAAAAGKHLSNEEFRAYLDACLVSTRPPADLFESWREIERRCNTIANDRQLRAQKRVMFMQSCRRTGG